MAMLAKIFLGAQEKYVKCSFNHHLLGEATVDGQDKRFASM